MLSKEPVVLINLPKRATGKPSNVVIRGVTQNGLVLRGWTVLRFTWADVVERPDYVVATSQRR